MRIIFLLLLIPHFLLAQKAGRDVVHLTPEDFSEPLSNVYDGNLNVIGTSLHEKKSEWISVPIVADPFLAFSVAWTCQEGQDVDIFYHFEGDEDNWTLLVPDAHYIKEQGRQVSTLIFRESHQKQLKLYLTQKENKAFAFESLDLHFFSPGESITPEQEAEVDLVCPCPQPTFLDRQGWCPNGDCTEHPNPQATTVTHLIVHHAASTNASSDWSGVVRSIWDYHVNTNGWDDIGYNWLIDPNGVVYEGRGDNIQGAHFCGKNGGTAGICMLGDFTTTTPTMASQEKLTEFLAWKACDINIDPEGMAFHNSSGLMLSTIAGHREGCSTACPGAQFFPLFSQLRSGVKNFQDQQCTPVGTDEWSQGNSIIEIVPNPSVGPVQLLLNGSYRGAVKISLIDLASRPIQIWNFNKEEMMMEETLGIKKIGTGIFYLGIEMGKETKYVKIVRLQ